MAWFEATHGQKGLAMAIDTDPLRSEHAALIKPYLPLKMGYATSLTAQAEQYAALVADSTVATICETGFNAGNSALLFLQANPHAADAKAKAEAEAKTKAKRERIQAEAKARAEAEAKA